MTKILAIFIIYFFLQSTMVLAVVPEQIIEHINRDFTRISMILKLGYSEKQKELVLDRYIDGLISTYKELALNIKPTEIRALLNARLAEASVGLKIDPDYLSNAMGPTDPSQLGAFINKYKYKLSNGYAKINVKYQGIEMPLFVENNHGKIHIFLDGVSKDSRKRAPGLGAGSGPSATATDSSSMECLQLIVTNEAYVEISIVNAAFTACPIPGDKAGKFLLGLSEELARGLGKSGTKLEDISTIRCEKNDESVRLARLKVFQEGNSWYGSNGYRGSSEDDAIMSTYRSFPLLPVQSEVNAKAKEDLNKTKEHLLSKAQFDFQKEDIFKDFSQFENIKPMFDDTVREFMSSNKILPSDSPSVGQFFSWLWKRDCARYAAIEKFLYYNSVNEDLGIRKITPIPKHLSKGLPPKPPETTKILPEASHKGMDKPKITGNILKDLFDYLEQGDSVVLRTKEGDQVFYKKSQTNDPTKIRFIILDVTGTNLGNADEYPWELINHFGQKLDEEFAAIYRHCLQHLSYENKIGRCSDLYIKVLFAGFYALEESVNNSV